MPWFGMPSAAATLLLQVDEDEGAGEWGGGRDSGEGGISSFTALASCWFWAPERSVWFSLKSLSLSSINLWFSFLIFSISCFMLLSVSSMLSILTRFLSLAFWAATLFFSFLRIIFSSEVRWSRLARFLTGGFVSSHSMIRRMSSSSSSSFKELGELHFAE